MLTKIALVTWGSGALAVSAVSVLIATQLTAGAAPAGGGTQSASTTAKVKPTPSATPTQGAGSGNNGNGVGNGVGGAEPPPKALVVTAIKPVGLPTSSPNLVTPIAPGVDGTLTVKVQNPNGQAVKLVNLIGKVTGVTPGVGGTPQCDAAWFDIVDYSGSLPIAKNDFVTLPLTVTFINLPDVNQDRCKGATYTFSFTATANKA